MPWQRYQRLLKHHPVLTNAITAGLIGGTGDIAAQQLENKVIKKRGFLPVSQLNTKRTAHVAAWGLVWLGAPMFWWFRWLDRRFPPGVGGVPKLVQKIAFNQFTMAPFSNGMFFGYIQLNQHGPEGLFDRFVEKLKGDFLLVTLNSCIFWVPAHVFNFVFLPPQFRILFLSCGMVAWTTYLDLVGHRPMSAQDGIGGEAEKAPVEA